MPENRKAAKTSKSTSPVHAPGKTSGASSKNAIYGRGYYHGENSGYPEEGYRGNHPDWDAWLDLIASILPPPASFFDIGTAFGYLPGNASDRGYQAAGCDISSYALAQEPPIRDRLIRGGAENLPVKSSSADIVCLFDILEHLDNPVKAMEEAVRILKPGGLLVGATPDPLFFDLDEETHCFERCPSFWIHHLERLGLGTVFRFSNIPENFQFLATFKDSPLGLKLQVFQHDYFSLEEDIPRLAGPEAEKANFVLRQGWEPLESEGRRISGNSASAYLLNKAAAPLECSISMEINCPSIPPRFQLRLDSLVLDVYSIMTGECSSVVTAGPFPLPPGGHHIHIDLSPSQQENFRIKSLKTEIIQEIPVQDHLLSLPFDLYQRYKFAGEIAALLNPGTILDAGGNLGDAGGHLAVSLEFLTPGTGKSGRVVSSDLRHCDHPDHVPGDGLQLPFDNNSFQMSVSLDVLEHIPPESRIAFLEELDRVTEKWILIAAPFSSAGVKQAESALVSELGLHFLDEHSELGLPEEELISAVFVRGKGRHIRRFENGHLGRWFHMLPLTQMMFSLHKYRLYAEFNSFYNKHYFEKDCTVPGYRTFFLISRDPIPEELDAALKSLPGFAEMKTARENPSIEFTAFPFYSDFLELVEERSRESADLSFLLTARERHIEDLRKKIEEYEQNPLFKILRKIRRTVRGRSSRQADVS